MLRCGAPMVFAAVLVPAVAVAQPNSPESDAVAGVQAQSVLVSAAPGVQTPLDAPSGRLGAGIGMASPGVGRAWLELSSFTGNDATILAPMFGFGVLATRNLEIEAAVPVVHISGGSESHTAIGNVYAGLNYFQLDNPVRFKVGGGIALPTAPTSIDGGLTSIIGAYPDAFQQLYLRIPNALGIVVPARIEWGAAAVVSLDAELAALISTKKTGSFYLRDDAELLATFAPGVGFRAGPPVLIGVRMPMFIMLTESQGDTDQVSIEPFVRAQIGTGFLSVRFTMPIDNPLGFAFDTGKFWGLHIGGGAAF